MFRLIKPQVAENSDNESLVARFDLNHYKYKKKGREALVESEFGTARNGDRIVYLYISTMKEWTSLEGKSVITPDELDDIIGDLVVGVRCLGAAEVHVIF